MSNGRNSPPSAYPADRRRASISGQMVDLLSSRSGSISGPLTNSNNAQQPGPISSAVRRLSLSTQGLAASPTQSSPFSPQARPRSGSFSSSINSGTIDENPFEDGDALASSMPSSSFGRRLSFGARAMRDMRTPSAPNGSTGNGPSGYDMVENFRSRAERSSISAPSGISTAIHQRARSTSIAEAPVREMPKQPRVPDAIQERMLRGDFYMD